MNEIERLLADLKIAGLGRERLKLLELVPLLRKEPEAKTPRSVRERTQEIDVDTDVDQWRPREPLKTKIQFPRTEFRPVIEKKLLAENQQFHESERKKFLSKAFIFAMDWEADGGTIPPEIDKLLHADYRMTKEEENQLIHWFFDTCPTDARVYG